MRRERLEVRWRRAPCGRATALDAATIADLQIQVWQQAFSDLLPAEVVLADPHLARRRVGVPAAAGRPGAARVRGREAVGFAAVSGEIDDRNLLAPIGEIEVLYVVPRWGRRGHGGRLLAGAATELRRLGASAATWWIPQTDTASAAFLASAGWSADGLRRELDTGAEPIFEIRYSGSVDLVAV